MHMLGWVFLSILLIFSRASADPLDYPDPEPIDELKHALKQLGEQLTLLDKIEPFIERQDLGRLRMLRRSSETVLNLIKTKRLVHNDTFRAYNLLIITYTNSELYFESVETNMTKNFIKRLKEISQEIIDDKGLPSASRITHIYFFEMKHRLDDLLDLSITEDLRTDLNALIPDFGDLLPKAKSYGDTRPTYYLADALYHKIKNLYPKFNKISDREPAFLLVVDIMGLAEFYREFSKMDFTQNERDRDD